MTKKISKSNGERGSALMIVFVMAAAVAILLYMEMPVAVFEAQRNKEQLLIDRGNEYARAAQLYFRKMRQYPPTLDAMENTNRMRFLRKRYKDPFTGKDDWRLLHAAPNGILTDSKVNPINNNVTGAGNSPLNGNNQTANNQTANNSSAFSGFNSPSSNSSSNSGFSGFNASSSSSAGTGTAETVVPALMQRRPAIAANPEASSPTTDSAVLNTGATVPAPVPASANPNAQTNTPQTTANGQSAGTNGTDPNNPFATNQNSTTSQSSRANPAAGRPGTSAFASSPFGSGSSSSGLGVIQGGGGVGIAGVASKAEGHSIKTVNDQEKYSLWEFHCDPTKDAMKAAAGALSQISGGQPGGNGQSPNTNFNSGPGSSSNFGNFGGGLSGAQNPSNNGFGQQGAANSGFGSFGNSGTNTSSSFGSTSSTSTTPSNPPASPPQQ